MITNKKFLDKNNPENTTVYIIFCDKFNEECECAGVLIREDKKSVRVAFSAKNDKVIDYLDIKRSDIMSINILNPSNIKKL